MDNSVLIITLALATLAIAVGVAIWQRFRASQAKTNHEHSALMDDPRMVHKERRDVG